MIRRAVILCAVQACAGSSVSGPDSSVAPPPPRITEASPREVVETRQAPASLVVPRPPPGAPALRPIAPLSGTRVRARRPVFRWEVPVGTRGARVEVCASRSCERLVATVAGDGGSGAPSQDLPAGRVFWRVRAGDATSAVWALDVRSAAGVTAATGATVAGDLSGDAFADALVSHTMGPPPTDDAFLYRGATSGIGHEPSGPFAVGAGRPGMLQGHRLPRGDVDGDGRSDLLAGRELLLAGEQGVDPPRARVVLEGEARIAVIADVNGDGFDDVVRADPYADTSVDPALGVLVVHRGRAGGVEAAASQRVVPPAADVRLLGTELARAGDLDGDGFDDVIAIGQAPGPPRAPSDFVAPHRVVLLRGGRDGLAWSRRVELVAGRDGPPFREAATSGPTWSAQWIVTEPLSDHDGDGVDDLALLERVAGGPTSGNACRVHLFLGGRERLRAGRSWDEPLGAGILGAGDLDGDGLGELVVAENRLRVLPGGASRPEVVLAWSGPAAAPGDLDGDGFGDLLVGGGAAVRVHFGGAGGPSLRPYDELLPNPAQRSSMGFADWVE